jgi:chitodextrinase
VVAASGNDGANSVSYPASLPDVIAVGSTGFTNQLAPYSNRGAALDVVAPGGNLNQDANGDGYPDGVLQETCDIAIPNCSSGWGYYFLQGTSMATPHVSGAAALLKSIAPGLNGPGIEAILEATALDLGPPGFDTSYGNGLIQLHDAISYLESPDTSPPLWPGGGQLSVDLVSETAVELQWPQANDDKAVAGYRIYQDGRLVETTPAGQTSVQISGLDSVTTYQFGVRAEDLAGNLSSTLTAEQTMPDSAPPIWPANSTLSVGKYGERQLTFRWSPAVDDTAVVEYALRLAGTSGLFTKDQTSTIIGLEPGHSYVFEVLAGDSAGNWSDVLSAPVRTARAFLDTPGTTFYDDILWMSGMDITRGCNPPTNDLFCPDDPVTRAQMAAFVVRALGLKSNDHPGFGDVPSDSTFAEDIGRLATAGITRGCNPPTNDQFCPDDLVTRGQLAAFLHRALSLDGP